MKKHLIYILPILFAAASCKNPVGADFGVKNPDDYSMIYTVQAVDDKSKNTVEMLTGADTTIMVYANHSGILAPAEDIDVRFTVAPGLVAAYNEEHGTSYTALPEENYSVSGLDVSIKKGERYSTPVTVSVASGVLVPDTYLLPLYIESVSSGTPINEELRTAYLFFVIADLPPVDYDDYDRSGWKILDVSSESFDDDRALVATNAIDGDFATFWHTPYKGDFPKHPHYIAIDMGEKLTLHGFRIRARTHSDGRIYVGGHPLSVDVFTKVNKNDEWTLQGAFEMEFIILDSRYFNSAVGARYFKLVVNTSYNGSDFASIAEIYTF